MSTEAALLVAVCAAPDDDLPRLVYADWCDEQGRHIRADFIRSQVELARLEKWFQGFTTRDERKANGQEFGRRLSFLRKRVKALVEHHREEATGVPNDFPFRSFSGDRGFITAIWVPLTRLALLPEALTKFGSFPPEVCVAGLGMWLTDDLDLFTSESAWSLVNFLCLVHQHQDGLNPPGPTPVQLGRLSTAPLTRLRHLDLENSHLTDAHARVLAERFNLPALRVLNMRGNPLSPAGVRALSEAAWWGGLHELSLSCSPPVRELVDVLTTARIPGLRSLTIGHNHELSGRVGERLRAELVAAYPDTVIEIT